MLAAAPSGSAFLKRDRTNLQTLLASTKTLPMTNIRLAQATDIPELAALYRQTVEVNAPQHYTPAQTQAWSALGAETEAFCQFILGVTTFVITDESGILGFAGIDATGHVASTYVRADQLGQGIGSTLMQTVLAHAHTHHLTRLYAEASEFSLGLFKKFGFTVYNTEVVDLSGVQFTRYLMEKTDL